MYRPWSFIFRKNSFYILALKGTIDAINTPADITTYKINTNSGNTGIDDKMIKEA